MPAANTGLLLNWLKNIYSSSRSLISYISGWTKDAKQMIDTKKYWEQRLSENYNLAGVGYRLIGEQYNYWIYKVRRIIFRSVIRKFNLLNRDTSVLDIGSGTGIYISEFAAKGCKNITGIDITTLAVSQLKKKYPGYRFFTADIADVSVTTKLNTTFNFIIAMDVFFHIVDNERYYQALLNVHKLLSTSGIFLLTENPALIASTHGHIKYRTKQEMNRLFESAGFAVLAVVPIILLMNPPWGSSNVMLWKFSNAKLRLLSWAHKKKYKVVGFIVGMIMFPIEYVLHQAWGKKPGINSNIYLLQKTK